MRFFPQTTANKKYYLCVQRVTWYRVGGIPPPGLLATQAVQRRFTHRKFLKDGETMDPNDQNSLNTEQQEQKAPPTCHTITDLFHPEKRKDSESPLAFGSWQPVGKF